MHGNYGISISKNRKVCFLFIKKKSNITLISNFLKYEVPSVNEVKIEWGVERREGEGNWCVCGICTIEIWLPL